MKRLYILGVAVLFFFCNPFDINNAGDLEITYQSIENDSLIYSSDTIQIIINYDLGSNYSDAMKAELVMASLLDSDQKYSLKTSIAELSGKSGTDTISVKPNDLWLTFDYNGIDNYRAYLFKIHFDYSDSKVQVINTNQIIYFYLKD